MPNREPDDELLAAALRGTNECPSLEELERLLAKYEASWLQQHVDACPHCQTELQMLRSFASNEVADHERGAVNAIAARLKSSEIAPQPASANVEERRPWRKSILAMRWLTPAAATVAVVLVVAGVAIGLRQGRQPQLNTRFGGSEVLRSSAIAILSPVGDLREKPRAISWEAVPNATRYRLRIMEVDRAELWSRETTSTRLDLPDAIEALLVPAKTLLIEVTAFDAAGSKIGESEPTRIRLLQNVYTH